MKLLGLKTHVFRLYPLLFLALAFFNPTMNFRIFTLFLLFYLQSCDLKTSAEYNAEAEILEKEEKFEEAILLLDKAIAKDPSNLYALCNRAVDKSILEDYQGAIEDYSRMLEIDPHNTLALLNRGKNKARLGDSPAALLDFEQAIKTKGSTQLYMDLEANPFVNIRTDFEVNMEVIRFERGLELYEIDSLGLAFQDFSFCIDKAYEKASSYYMRALIYHDLGYLEEGCTDLQQAQELGDPDAPTVLKQYCK